MSSDRSRPIDQPRFGYTGVVAQQGRVTLDRDVNAQAALAAERTRLDALAIVGPCGTPDDGYRVSTVHLASEALSAEGIVLPRPRPPHQPPIEEDWFNFRIGPGTMYLGGERVSLAEACSYAVQPEWPAPTQTAPVQHELVWLDVVETEVGATEDADLRDVALGGPDTTARLKLLQRIRRTALNGAPNCAGAWASMIDGWAQQGLAFDPATMRLSPQVALQIAVDPAGVTANPCDPVAAGGYLGPENQLLRLRVTMIGGAPNLVWGNDNASALYQVKACTDGKTLTLTADPPDVFLYPAQGQWIEVLGAAAIYGTDTGVAGIPHYVAEPAGTMHRLAQPYGQSAGSDGVNQLVLDVADPLLAGFTGDPAAPVFVRVWQTAQPIGASAGAADIALTDVAGNATGLIAQLRWSEALADGACWEVAARPATPQGVYPAEYCIAPQPAIGPRRWVCPLAVIDWSTPWDAAITDCRNAFDTLVELTARRSGCCRFSIDPGDVGGGAGLQAAIDRARDTTRALTGTGGAYTVCLGPGNFALPGPLRLDASHGGMVLEAAAGRTVLAAAIGADPAAFADGIVVVTGAAGITLHGLEIQPAEAPIPRSLLDGLGKIIGASELNIAALGAPRMAFGIRVAACLDLTIERCTVAFAAERPDTAADLIGAGIFVQGANGDLMVTDCLLTSALTPSFTPLRFGAATTSPIFTHVLDGLSAAATGDRATFINKLGLASGTFPAAMQNQRGGNAVETGIDDPAEPRTERSTRTKPAKQGSAPSAATPLTPGDLGDQTSLAGWAAIVGRRMTGARAAPAIALAGLLAADSGSRAVGTAQLACVMGDARISGNRVAAMGFGALVIASFDALRLRDNRCVDGIAGLWVKLPGAVPPPAREGVPAFYLKSQMFEEFQYLQALASALSPPDDPSPADRPTIAHAAPSPATPMNALWVTGNDVRLRWRPPAAAPAAAALSGAALMIALCRENQFVRFAAVSKATAFAPPAEAIVAGNGLWSGSGYEAPTALVTLARGGGLAMTGNMFTNAVADTPVEKIRDQPALSIEIPYNEAGNYGVAIAGNAVRGWSNLATLPRPHPAPLNNWSGVNADPA